MTIELFLSFAALAVSVASAVFAKRSSTAAEAAADSAARSASSAEHANDIALHNSRLELYKALQHFQMRALQAGPKFPDSELWTFWDVVKLSEFYFNEVVHKGFHEVADQAHMVKTWQSQMDADAGDPQRAGTTRTRLNSEFADMRKRCTELDEQVRAALRLASSRPELP